MKKKVVLVVQGVVLVGDLVGGKSFPEALKGDVVQLANVEIKGVSGAPLPELTVLTAHIGAFFSAG